MYSMRKTAWQYSELLVFVGLVALAAASGNVFEPGPFYAALHKPAWTPPDDVFAPVWAALYVMIALAGWIGTRIPGSTPVYVKVKTSTSLIRNWRNGPARRISNRLYVATGTATPVSCPVSRGRPAPDPSVRTRTLEVWRMRERMKAGL